MILVDTQIRDKVGSTGIVAPFDTNCVQPASYDLRIGSVVYAPPKPDEPMDLSANGGVYRLPPYGNAVLTTYENLKLPPNLLGRIGLKSGFARRGIVASTGPQIDPGFKGKLFVSVFNLAAASHVFKYQDTFLTIEFHELEAAPEKTYEGPYQGRYSIGAEVLDALVRLEGMTLSEMQTQFTQLERHVKAWSEMAGRIDEFLLEMKQHTAAIADLSTRMKESIEIQAPLEARAVPLDQAVGEILNLFRKRKRLFYSDIAEALRLDFATVVRACEHLQRKGLIEGDLNGKTRAKRPRN
jgi:dCTP deaminase